jgi:hypothetical protein
MHEAKVWKYENQQKHADHRIEDTIFHIAKNPANPIKK